MRYVLPVHVRLSLLLVAILIARPALADEPAPEQPAEPDQATPAPAPAPEPVPVEVWTGIKG